MTIEPIQDAPHAPDLDATDARQGRRGRHVFVILIVSLALIVVGYVVIYAIHAHSLTRGQGGQETAPASAAQALAGPEPKAPEVNSQSGYSPPPTASQPSATTPS